VDGGRPLFQIVCNTNPPHSMVISLGQWDIEFVLGDAAYGSEKIRQTAEQAGILFLSPINRRK